MNPFALRLGLGVLGLGLALVAISRDDRRITWVAIGVLALALALRFYRPPGGRPPR